MNTMDGIFNCKITFIKKKSLLNVYKWVFDNTIYHDCKPQKIIDSFLFKGTLYLVKWSGFSETETTWEPHSHIDSGSLSQYIPNVIDANRLMSAAKCFEEAMYQRLRRGNRNNTFQINFELDMFRYCFTDDKQVLLNSADDFTKLPLSSNWHYRISQNGTGQTIKFPVRITPKLRFRKTYLSINGEVVEKTKPLEIISVVTATCNF